MLWINECVVKSDIPKACSGGPLYKSVLCSEICVYIQWLQKLVHIWQFFPCKANCGSDNKAKLVTFFCNKAKYCGPVCTKYQNISFMYWFNTAFTMTTTQWTSFCALPNFWVCHRYHMTKPSISCKYVSITYIGPTSIITPLINMSTVSKQTILTLLQNGYSWHKVATPDIKWLPKHMSATLQSEDTALSSVTPSPGSVVGTQPGILLKAKTPCSQNHIWSSSHCHWTQGNSGHGCLCPYY